MKKAKIGRFEIQDELGRGAMGTVFRAHDPELNRVVAIKTINLDAFEEGAREEMVARFQREARLAGSLSHPNIITIYDVGKDKDTYYIAMEYIDGSSLKRLLEAKRLTTVEDKLRIFQAACDGLHFAHSNGVIHRDVKPSNILLTKSGQVKVSDFGVARLTTSSTLTQAGTVIGTVAYMSPEQIRGEEVDGRSDVFSLGIVLYELLTGERPFEGYSPTTIMHKVVNEHPVPPQILNAQVPREFNEIVLKALAKDPHKRFASCADLISELRTSASSQGIQLPEATATAPPLSIATDSDATGSSIAQAVQRDVTESRASRGTAPSAVRAAAPAKKKGSSMVWLAAAVVVLLAGGGAAFLLGRPGSAPAAAVSDSIGELATVPQPAVAQAPEKPAAPVKPQPQEPVPEPPKPPEPKVPENLTALDDLDARPQASRRADPDYPEQALQQKLSGKVFVKALINESGEVVSAEALPTEAPRVLKEAFAAAVRQWRYSAPQKGGKPVKVELIETFDFVLPPEPVKTKEGDLVSLADATTPPRLERAVTPSYPASAQQAGAEGTVVLSALINERGEVANAEVLPNSVADPALRQAAREAVRGYKYTAAEKDGVKVKVYVEIPVQFKLERKAQIGPPPVQEGDLVELTGEMSPPRAIHKSQPAYPAMAKRLREQGTVVVRALVNERGDVTEVKLISGPTRLTQAALDAVQKWKFEPAVKDGKRVKVYTTVAVDFRLP